MVTGPHRLEFAITSVYNMRYRSLFSVQEITACFCRVYFFGDFIDQILMFC